MPIPNRPILRRLAIGAPLALVLAVAACGDRELTAPASGTADVEILATFEVTTLADAGAGSLRQAIMDANANPGADVITFDPALAGTVLLASPLPALADQLTIAGPGAHLVGISGNNAVRVFDVAAGATVTISDLTITEGSAPGSTPGDGTGGGIRSAGTLALLRCVLTNNRAGYFGGAIYSGSSSPLSVASTTIAANTAFYYGGAIYSDSPVTVTNSTISANAGYYGAGFYVPSTTLVLVSSTVAGNVATSEGGAIYGANALLANTILANNRAAGAVENCTSPYLTDGGYNLEAGDGGAPAATCGLGATSQSVADAMLGPLADNGGPTPTHALLPGSPAIGMGDPAGSAEPYDQRGDGYPRVSGGRLDVGAFELQAAALPDEGCALSFWKGKSSGAAWTAAGYAKNQTLESVFDVPDVYGLDNVTLSRALDFKGGSGDADAARILLRHAVPALLNAAHPEVNYPRTAAQLIAAVNAVLATGDRAAMLALAEILDAENNVGCPLS